MNQQLLERGFRYEVLQSFGDLLKGEILEVISSDFWLDRFSDESGYIISCPNKEIEIRSGEHAETTWTPSPVIKNLGKYFKKLDRFDFKSALAIYQKRVRARDLPLP